MKYSAFLILYAAAAAAAPSVIARHAPHRSPDAVAPAQVEDASPPDIAPPDIAAALAALVGVKGEACYAALDAVGVRYTRLPDTPADQPCHLTDAMSLDASWIPYSKPLETTCPLSAALAAWEKTVVMPEAEAVLGSPVVEIEAFGSYSCRRVNNSMAGSFSQHATGNAVDISGFRLADGRLVDVQAHWGTDTPEGRFLESVRNEACTIYSVVLSPDYNAAHANHFHFDMGPEDLCN